MTLSPATLLGTPVQLFGWSANNVAATQCISAHRHGQDDLLKFKPSIRMGKKGDLSDFECGMVVGARRAGLSISETADLLGFSRTIVSRVYRECSEKEKISSERQFSGWKYLVECRDQRRMVRMAQADRKATVTQITTCYNRGTQKSISERTTRWTLKQMGYGSRRPRCSRRCHSCQLRTGNWGYSGHGLTKIRQYEIGKTLPGLMSLSFCCDIQTVGSEFVPQWHKSRRQKEMLWPEGSVNPRQFLSDSGTNPHVDAGICALASHLLLQYKTEECQTNTDVKIENAVKVKCQNNATDREGEQTEHNDSTLGEILSSCLYWEQHYFSSDDFF